MNDKAVLLLASLAGMLLVGCSQSGSGGSSGGASATSTTSGGTSAPPATPKARVDDSQFLARAAHVATSDGQITTNNPWTPSDLAKNFVDPVNWTPTTGNFRWQGTTYTTLVSQYRERRKQCELDQQVTYAQRYPDYPFGPDDLPNFSICYPTLESKGGCRAVVAAELDPNLQPGPRYGYYCGAGHPPLGPSSAIAPEPLDAVDFCCMLHDAQAWGRNSDDPYYNPTTMTNGPNERGIVMCLATATEYPAGAISNLPDIEAARQFWYGCAALADSHNQFNDVPAPVLGR